MTSSPTHQPAFGATAVAPDAPGVRALTGPVLWFLCASVIMRAIENFVPKPVEQGFEAITAAFLAAITIRYFTSGAEISRKLYLFIPTAAFVTISLFLTIGGLNDSKLDFALRYISSGLAMFLILMPGLFRFSPRGKGFAQFFTCLAIWIAGVYALLGPPIVVGTARLAVFAGGETGLHPSAYSVCGLLILMLAFGTPQNKYARLIFRMTAVLAVLVIVLYQVRTVYVLLGVFGAFYWISRWPEGVRRPFVTLSAVLAPAFLALAALGVSLIDQDFLIDISSGRWVNYQERIEIIFSRDIGQVLAGTGPGTDFFRGEVKWKFVAKNSHNDILMMLIETGVLGLAAILAMIVLIGRTTGGAALYLFVAVLATSLVSNGIITRAPIMTLFVFSVAVFQLRRLEAPEPETPGADPLLPAADPRTA